MLGKTLRIVGLMLLLLPSAGQAETMLESLVWEDGVLILGFDGPYESRSMVLSDPDRIVLDFPEIRSGLRVHNYDGTGELQTIRVGQNEPEEPGGKRVRVVLDLASSHDLKRESVGRFMRIALSPGEGTDLSETPVVTAVSTPTAAPEPEATPASIELAFEEETDSDSELPIVAESAALPAPPPEIIEPETVPAAAARPVPALLGASAGAVATVMNPMMDLPEETMPAPEVTPEVDLGLEDSAPAEWEDAIADEFAQLSPDSEAIPSEPAPEPALEPVPETAVNPTEPIVEFHEASTEPEAVPAPIVHPAEEVAQAVLYGDPFEMDTRATVESGELRSAATQTEPEPAPEPEAEPELVSVIKVEARPVTKSAPATPAAKPIGRPVVIGADMASASGWTVTTSSGNAPAAAASNVETTPAQPVRTATRVPDPTAAPVTNIAATPEPTAAVVQVASSHTPQGRTAAAASAPADEAAMRKALSAGHLRIKPDEAAISLEMRGADFKTLLRAFSEFSGQNIIAGREVKGKVSVNLSEVPWREALMAVCSAHGYGVKEEYGVLRVGPRGTLLQEEMELLTADKKRAEYRTLETRVVKLSYAVASELISPLSKMLGERGKMDVDERTNSLLITDLPESLEQIVELAKGLDHLMPQVEIMAKIIDVDYYASRDLGISWEALNLVNTGTGLAGQGSITGEFPQPVGEFKLGKVMDWGEINMTIQALEKQNKADIISKPRVMTMDNREANILVGKKIPLIVADEAGNAITQLTTIGIKLVVTPHINPDGQIMMHVSTEVSDLSSEATVQGGVIITTSESKTNVMVGDGETAVIAGLLKNSETNLDNEVPFLGKIPILGNLFGYSNDASNKRELLIFITPRVVHPGGETSADDLRDFGFSVPLGG